MCVCLNIINRISQIIIYDNNRIVCAVCKKLSKPSEHSLCIGPGEKHYHAIYMCKLRNMLNNKMVLQARCVYTQYY